MAKLWCLAVLGAAAALLQACAPTGRINAHNAPPAPAWSQRAGGGDLGDLANIGQAPASPRRAYTPTPLQAPASARTLSGPEIAALYRGRTAYARSLQGIAGEQPVYFDHNGMLWLRRTSGGPGRARYAIRDNRICVFETSCRTVRATGDGRYIEADETGDVAVIRVADGDPERIVEQFTTAAAQGRTRPFIHWDGKPLTPAQGALLGALGGAAAQDLRENGTRLTRAPDDRGNGEYICGRNSDGTSHCRWMPR